MPVKAIANAPQMQLLWANARYQEPLVATAAIALELRVEWFGFRLAPRAS